MTVAKPSMAGKRGAGSGVSPPTIAARRPTWALLVVAVASLLLAIFLSAELLMHVGPIRETLVSPKPLERWTARFEIEAFRIACLALSVMLLAIAVFWRSLMRCRLVQRALAADIRVARDAAADGLTNFSLWTMAAALVIGLLYLAYGGRVFSRAQLEALDGKVGIIQTAQAIIWLACAAIATVIAVREPTPPRRRMHGLMAFGFLLCVGEETNWGQQFIGYATPQTVALYNMEGVMNLHNLVGTLADHVFIILAFAYGALLPALVAWSPLIDRLAGWLGLPLPSPGLALGFLAASFTHYWLIGLVFKPTVLLLVAEMRELLTPLAFLLLMRESWRILGQAPRAGPRP